jgi:catechol 2,3-dioxygenase-like lactoylglutathione lyase family enzyme
VRIRSLSQVGMTVKDLRRSIDFYWDNLGLPVVAVMELPSFVIKEVYGVTEARVKVALLRCGWGSFIELFEFTPAQKAAGTGPGGPALTHVALDVPNVDRIYRKLSAKGVKFLGPPTVEKGSHLAFLRDPDGHLVELIDMGPLYWVNKLLGGIVGRINMVTKFRDRDKL